jgi:hypothetical protein
MAHDQRMTWTVISVAEDDMRAIMTAAILVVGATTLGAAEQTWTGAVSETMCGADHSKMGGKMSAHDCTVACTKSGVPYALVAAGKVYKLSGHDADLRAHAGETVVVTGELKGDTIRVAKVTADSK